MRFIVSNIGMSIYNLEDISRVKDFMIQNNHSLAVAESVTSGHLQAALSLATDASRFFQGGITTYNLGQKSRHLRIDPIHGMSCNSVSEKIADEMAVNAGSLFSSDWAVGITGYASPFPEFGIKELFAFYAIAFKNEVVHRGKIDSPDTGIYHVQVCFAGIVLKELNLYLNHTDKR